ncbi:MAG: serine hydrolase [Syntrophomonadaceae bacterium]|nr:serine hydrolase [Syntrophomonadaceae bacterium]
MKKMRKICLVLCLAIFVSALFFIVDTNAVVAEEQKEIKVLLDNQSLDFDVPPVIINDRTMVPFRIIFEALGATVEWESTTKTVSACKDDIKISFIINGASALKNEAVVNLDVPAQILNGRTLVPLRFVSTAMGANVTWDDINKTVIITTVKPTDSDENEAQTITTETAPQSTSDGWKTSVPSVQGLDPQIINNIYKEIDDNNLKVDSVLIVKNGNLVAEKYFGTYTWDTPHQIFSDTKSITSTLVGIARDKGKINLDDKVVDFFPDKKFENKDAVKDSIAVRDLLTMTSGIQWPYSITDALEEMMQSDSWVDFVLNRPMETKPGTVFNYNTGGMEVLSAILNNVNGMTEEEFAQQYLFGPLGITDYKWLKSPEGYSAGGTGLAMRPRDMAKIGQLMLQNGVWDGQQIVSADWVGEATTAKISSTSIPGCGYGYNWWIRPDIQGYFASGLYGQLIYVLPSQNMVVVFTANEDTTTMLKFGKSCVEKLQ